MGWLCTVCRAGPYAPPVAWHQAAAPGLRPSSAIAFATSCATSCDSGSDLASLSLGFLVCKVCIMIVSTCISL